MALSPEMDANDSEAASSSKLISYASKPKFNVASMQPKVFI